MNRSVLNRLQLVLGLALSVGAVAVAAPKNEGLESDVLEAKTRLERLISERYAQSLATMTEKGSFTLSSFVDIVEVPMPSPKVTATATTEDLFPATEVPKNPSDDLPPDLKLGQINMAELFERYERVREREGRNPSARIEFPAPVLRRYRITNVKLVLGVADGTTAEAKKEIETFMQTQMKAEFGKTGKLVVNTIKAKPEAPNRGLASEKDDKSLMDRLAQLQTLIAAALAGFMGLMGLLIWKSTMMTTAEAQRRVDMEMRRTDQQVKAKEAQMDEAIEKREAEEAKLRKVRESVSELESKILEQAASLEAGIEPLIESWVKNGGDDGKRKAALLYEFAPRLKRPIPVPASAKDSLGDAFAQMASLDLGGKISLLENLHWDLVAYKNLGKESVERPFSYLEASKSSVVKTLVEEQSPNLRAVVTLLMPNGARNRLLKSLSEEARLELFEQAFRLGEVPADEILSTDESLKTKVGESMAGGARVDVGPLLPRLFEALSPDVEITTLRSLQSSLGTELGSFRRTYVTPAFLPEWSDDALRNFLDQAPSEELLPLLRLLPDFKDRVLSLAPGMTAEILKDDLSAEDRLSSEEKANRLLALRDRLQQWVNEGRVDLLALFPEEGMTDGGSSAQAA